MAATTFAPKVSLETIVTAVAGKHAGLQQLTNAQGIPMDRVVCQGYVVKPPNNAQIFYIADAPEGMGARVKVSGRWIEDVQSLPRGAYVEITGGLKATSSQPKKDAAGTATTPPAQGGLTATIHAHKMSRLEDPSEHAELWEEELTFLNTHVYPLLASASRTLNS